jgi:IS5 family transposase
MGRDTRTFQRWLRAQLDRTGISMRQLSLAVRPNGPAYIAQILQTPPRRSIPTPDDLRIIADRLRVGLVEALEVAWSIDPQELAHDLAVRAIRAELGVTDLEPEDIREIENFIAWVRAKRENERRMKASHVDGRLTPTRLTPTPEDRSRRWSCVERS